MITLSLDKRNLNKDGTYPIKLLLTHHGKSHRIGIGKAFRVREADFTQAPKWIKGTAESAGRLRGAIKAKLNLADQVIDELGQEECERLSTKKLTTTIKTSLNAKKIEIVEGASTVQGEDDPHFDTLIDWCTEIKQRKEAEKKFGSADWYEKGASRFVRFFGVKDLPLNEITRTRINRYKAAYLGKAEDDEDLQRKKNGCAVVLKAIRALLNSAVDEGYLDPKFNPFDAMHRRKKVRIEQGKPKKRAQKEDVIRDLAALYQGQSVNGYQLEVGTSEWEIVAQALFMFECYGINFKDMVLLRVGAVIQNTFTFRRVKTTAKVTVLHSNTSLEIAHYFANGKEPDDFLFPWGYENTKEGYRRYKRNLNIYNTAVKMVIDKLGYEGVNLTTYAVRHTFATLANKAGMRKVEVGAMLGHMDPVSTDAYIDEGSIKEINDKLRSGKPMY